MEALAKAAALGFLLTALAGCLGAAPPPEEPLAPTDEGDDAPPAPPPRRTAPPPASPPPPTASNTTNRSSPSPPPSPPPPPDYGPQVVIAHIDTGINPYHRAFRDPGPLGQVHPSAYLPGFPADAPALRITLTAATYDEAVARDRALWEGVEPGKLYWIPGTRIVGAIRMGPGGTDCADPLLTRPELPPPVPPLPIPPDVLPPAVECIDLPLLDEHGHGTMTASRMAGEGLSLCPACRIVTIEGLGPEGVRWAADQGWIDVQTNSWGTYLPGVVPENPALYPTAQVRDAFAHAAQRMLVFAASGNGIAFSGGVGELTFLDSTHAAGVVSVGAHDNGYLNVYHGQPPHVVADGYGGPHARHRHLEAQDPAGTACCTSAASPYAAGGAAAMLLEARVFLDARGAGFREGVGAEGARAAAAGPLADGKLSLDEARRALLLTATPRPREGPHDGLAHWLARPSTSNLPADPANPGANPYCVACVALPVRWFDVPAEAPLYNLVGYGSVDSVSLDLARRVLRGEAAAPVRDVEDAVYGADQLARGTVDGLP